MSQLTWLGHGMIGGYSHREDVVLRVRVDNLSRGAELLHFHHTQTSPVGPVEVLIEESQPEWMGCCIHPLGHNTTVVSLKGNVTKSI